MWTRSGTGEPEVRRTRPPPRARGDSTAHAEDRRSVYRWVKRPRCSEYTSIAVFRVRRAVALLRRACTTEDLLATPRAHPSPQASPPSSTPKRRLRSTRPRPGVPAGELRRKLFHVVEALRPRAPPPCADGVACPSARALFMATTSASGRARASAASTRSPSPRASSGRRHGSRRRSRPSQAMLGPLATMHCIGVGGDALGARSWRCMWMWWKLGHATRLLSGSAIPGPLRAAVDGSPRRPAEVGVRPCGREQPTW